MLEAKKIERPQDTWVEVYRYGTHGLKALSARVLCQQDGKVRNVIKVGDIKREENGDWRMATTISVEGLSVSGWVVLDTDKSLPVYFQLNLKGKNAEAFQRAELMERKRAMKRIEQIKSKNVEADIELEQPVSFQPLTTELTKDWFPDEISIDKDCLRPFLAEWNLAMVRGKWKKPKLVDPLKEMLEGKDDGGQLDRMLKKGDT